MVTTAERSTWPLDWRIVDLQAAGLKQPCLIRMKLFSLDERLLLEPLGKLALGDQKGLESRLAALLAMPGPTST